MKINVLDTKQELGKSAAANVADAIKKTITAKGNANIILTTIGCGVLMMGSTA